MNKDKGLEHYLKSFSIRDKAAEKCISLMPSDGSGGRITYDQIDTLKRCPDALEIWASGLTQETFDYLIDHYGQHFKIIHFWKCPLISDLTKLEKLTKLEYVLFFWNQRATHLWDLVKKFKEEKDIN